MSSERLNAALQALQQSRVTPELISDEMVRGLSTRRSTVAWWLAALGVVGVICVGVWMNRQMLDSDQDAVHTQHSMIGTSGLVADQQHPAAGVSTSDSARSFNDEGLDTLDPNSILVLNLSDQELSRLGISRNNDTVYVTMQSLVVDDTAIAKKLGLEPATLRDSSALFHWRCSATPTGVDHIVPTTYDGPTLDHLVPFGVYSIDSNNYIAPVRAIHQAIVDQSDRDNELSLGNHPFVYTVDVDSLAYEGHLPKTLLPRDQKPIMIQVHNRHTRQRVVVLYMSTERMIAKMPPRFTKAIRHCYDAYRPKQPKPYIVPKATPRTEANLVKIQGVVGQPYVELTDQQLARFWIARDSVTIFRLMNGCTLDTALTSYRYFERFPAYGRYPFVPFHYSKGTVKVLTNGRLVEHSPPRWCPQPCLVMTEANGATLDHMDSEPHSVLTAAIPVGSNSGWYSSYPRAVKFVENAYFTLGLRKVPIDSIQFYWVVERGVTFPITRLLVPIRVTTPWTYASQSSSMPRRLTTVYWYAPTQDVLDSLPADLASFLRPEYEALMRSIEDHLSAAELCSLLDKPSAFGLCSIGDTTLRIDGVGPIPARESFTVFMQCALATTATIKLISDDGRTVLERSQISLVKGANQIPIQLAGQNIPQGAYTVVVSCAEGTRTSRVLIATQ